VLVVEYYLYKHMSYVILGEANLGILSSSKSFTGCGSTPNHSPKWPFMCQEGR